MIPSPSSKTVVNGSRSAPGLTWPLHKPQPTQRRFKNDIGTMANQPKLQVMSPTPQRPTGDLSDAATSVPDAASSSQSGIPVGIVKMMMKKEDTPTQVTMSVDATTSVSPSALSYTKGPPQAMVPVSPEQVPVGTSPSSDKANEETPEKTGVARRNC